MDRVTFITGASSGFGAALASHYASRGHAVALVARRAERIEELAATIERAGGRALALPCDVTDREAVQEAVARCTRELGRVNLLIANAGVSSRMLAARFSTQELRRVMDINLFGAAHCIEAVLPAMLEAGQGHIVGISSLAAYNGIPTMGAYSASKAALSALLESLRIELRPRGIDVTTIQPGFVKTEMIASMGSQLPFLMELDEAVERMVAAIERKDTEYSFPARMALLSIVGRLLPNRMSDSMLAAAARRQRDRDRSA